MQVDLPIASPWTGRHGALRAGSAGEQPATAYGTCLPVLQNHSTPGTNQNLYREVHLNLRFTAGFPPIHASFSTSSPVPAYRRRKCGKSTPKNQNCVLSGAPSAGAGKNALFPSRSLSARGALGVAVGVGFGVGVRTTDSHAPSNTWESVQEFGLPGNGVVI